MKLQNRVREFRAKHRLSQGDLGKAIGSSRQTISLIERGDYAPSIVLSLKIAQIFECTGGGNICVSGGGRGDGE